MFMLALAIACGAAQAAEWSSPGKSAGGTEMFLDTYSIRVAGHIRRAWLEIVAAQYTKMEQFTRSLRWRLPGR
jgi:hypothetical protein